LRNHLADAISLAESAEPMIELRRQTARPLEIVVFEHLVCLRRLSSAIERLCTALSYEAGIIERTMVEAWTNLQWILLDDGNDRADRFMKFVAVEMTSMLEEIPKQWQLPEEKLRLWREMRLTYRDLFQRRTKGGSLRWDKSWAKVGTMKGRLVEVLRARLARRGESAEASGSAIDASENTAHYSYYRNASQRTHVTQAALEQMFGFTSDDRLVSIPQPHVDPTYPLEIAAAILLDVLQHAVTILKLPLQDEVTAASNRGRELTRTRRGGEGRA
jgi:hypothetical protein